VNPAGQIPAVAYGGPQVQADQPSPASAKLAESLVLVEFIADLFPDSKIRPKDPLQLAKARFFVEISRGVVVPVYTFLRKGESEALEKELEKIQSLLPADAKFALGDDFTIADIAVAPLLARFDIMLKNELGVLGQANGKELIAIFKGPKFARLWKYYEDIKSRDSFKKTFDEAATTGKYLKLFGGKA